MSYEHQTLEQRYQIAALHRAGSSNKAIAEAVGCHPSTIGRELRRNCPTNRNGVMFTYGSRIKERGQVHFLSGVGK